MTAWNENQFWTLSAVMSESNSSADFWQYWSQFAHKNLYRRNKLSHAPDERDVLRVVTTGGLRHSLEALTLDDVFIRAYQTVVETTGQDRWLAMSPAEQTSLIYAEMRRIDAQRAEARRRKEGDQREMETSSQ